MSKCIDKLKEVYGDKFNDAELKEIDSYVESLKNKYAFNAKEYKKQLSKAVTDAEITALRKQKSIVNNVVRLKKNVDFIVENSKFVTADEALTSLLYPSKKPLANSVHNVENYIQLSMAENMSQFNSLLKTNGLFETLIDEQLQKAVWNEYLGRARDPNYVSKSSKIIQNSTDAINKLNSFLIGKEQGAGSTVLFNSERLVSNMHNPDKIIGNEAQWIEDAADMFISDDPRLATLKGRKAFFAKYVKTFEDFTKGDTPLGAFMGGEKTLKFVNGDAAFEYNKMYGYNNLYEGLMRSIKTSATKESLTRVFGDNPLKGFNDVKSFVEDSMGDAKKIHINKANEAMAYYRGQGHRFKDPTSTLAKTFKGQQIMKTYNVLRYLGNVGWAVTQDIPMTLLSVQTAGGRSVVGDSFTVLGDFIKNLPKALQKDATDFSVVLLNDIQKEFLDMTEGFTLGSMGKMADIYGTISLAKPLTQVTKGMAQDAHLRVLNNNIFDTKLNEVQKTARSVMGLTDGDLKNLRNIYEKGEYLDLSKIFSSGLDEKVARDLFTKLGSYINGKVADSVPTMGVREALITKKHLPKDDPVRQLVGIVSELKTSLLTVGNTWEKSTRYLNPKDGKITLNSTMSIAKVALAMLTFNYGQQYLRDQWENKDNSDYNPFTGELELKRFKKAVANTAVGGIFADAAMSIATKGELGVFVPTPKALLKDIPKAAYEELKYQFGNDLSVNRKMDNRAKIDNIPDLLERHSDLLPGRNLWLIQGIKGHIINEAERLR